MPKAFQRSDQCTSVEKEQSRGQAWFSPSLLLMIIVNQGIGREKQAASTSRARCSPSAVSSHHPRNPQVAQARPWEDSPPHLNLTMVMKYTSTMAVCYKGALLVVCYKGNTSHRAGAYLGHVANSCPTTKSFVRGEFAIRIRISFLWLFLSQISRVAWISLN